MLRIKKTARTAAGRTIALMLALLIVASFMQIGIKPASVSASGSATLSGGETININLSDSSWQGSDIRVKFLNSVVDNLKLSDVECVHSRTEDLARNKAYREKFDLCTEIGRAHV